MINMEKERLDFRKYFQNNMFSTVFEGPEDSFWMTLGVLLGASWGPLGRLVAVLEASLGCLECLGTLRSV